MKCCPIEEIIQRARAAGIITVIDGAHVPGQIPLDLDALGADFYGGNLRKAVFIPQPKGDIAKHIAVQNLRGHDSFSQVIL